MATIPVGYSEATFLFSRAGGTRDAMWTLGLDDELFALDTPFDIAYACQQAAAFGTDAPYLAANMQASWTFKGVRVTKMQEVGPWTQEFLYPVVGTITDAAVPPNSAILVRKLVSAGGRRNRGRFFVPPVYPVEGSIDSGGNIAAGSVAILQTRYTKLFTNLTDVELKPRLFHAEAPFTPSTITGFAVQTTVATQRRRLRK